MARAVLLASVLLLLAAPPPAVAKKPRRRRTSSVAVPAAPSAFDEYPDAACPLDDPAAMRPAELSEFGHELERDGRQPEALACYAASIRAAPREATGWLDLAIARQHADPPLAIRLYEHGLSLEPTPARHSALGVMLRVAGRYGEAAFAFRTAARLAPNDAEPLFLLGGVHEERHAPAEALHVYRRALDAEVKEGLHLKNEARIHNNIGTVLGGMGRWGEAIAALQESEDADPDFADAPHNLAQAR